MLEVIPVYAVTIYHGADEEKWRVPRTELEAFLHVLIFNAEADWRVTREDTWREHASEVKFTDVRTGGEVKS